MTETSEAGQDKKPKLRLKPPKKRGWRTVSRETVRLWKKKAYKRRKAKAKYDSVAGANKAGGVPKNGKTRRKPQRYRAAHERRIKQIAVLRAGAEGKQITLPPRNVLAASMPKVAPPRLEALLGWGNYRRIAKASGFSPMHISNVLRRGKNCSFWAAAQIADAAGVTMDELRIYTEIVRNRVKTETESELIDKGERPDHEEGQ